MLDLGSLAEGCPAITAAFGQYLAEAGSVCLESQGHVPGVLLSIRGLAPQDHEVVWPEATEQMRRCLNDPEAVSYTHLTLPTNREV